VQPNPEAVLADEPDARRQGRQPFTVPTRNRSSPVSAPAAYAAGVPIYVTGRAQPLNTLRDAELHALLARQFAGVPPHVTAGVTRSRQWS
jgi:hypothetical protein